MKLKKYVKVVAPVLLVIGIVLLGVSVYQVIHTNSLGPDESHAPDKNEWIICGGCGIAMGILQIVMSVLMFFAPTGHTDVKTPLMFLVGALLLFVPELGLLIAALVLGVAKTFGVGKAFVAFLVISLIALVVAMGWLIYKMTQSKIFKFAGSRAAGSA